MKRKLQIFSLLPVLFGLAAGSLHATSVRTVNLEEMVRYSDRIFWGRCLFQETEVVPGSGMTVRRYRFRVIEGLKGVAAGDMVTFRQVLGFPGKISGVPHYSKGQELLLFLHGDSRLGLTSPVGMYQGTFKRVKMPGGESGFVNGMTNRNLAAGLGTRSLSASLLTGHEMQVLRSGRPLSLSEMRSMVSKINFAAR